MAATQSNHLDNLKIFFTLLQLFITTHFAFSQSRLDTSLSAFRHGKIYNYETQQWDTFALCGQNVTVDTTGFFTMQSGCERNIAVFLGRYIYKSDTFKIQPFDFIREPQFLLIKRIPSNNPTQKIQFFTADYQPIKGVDSSWVVRLFRRRKSFIVDKTGDEIITIKRKRFDGMELLQMTKLFGLPVVLFLDLRFDYKIVINLPQQAVGRFITGGGSIAGGTGTIKGNALFLNDDKESFKIFEARKIYK